MSETVASVRKTFKYKLMPTPKQEQAMESILWRCRELYNAGLEERKLAWEKCHVSVTFAMQSAQLPGIKEVRPEYRDINKSINDAGWYAFRLILACKAAWAGKRVEAIPPAFTTQDCSGCGERIWKSLSVRTHVCTICGLMLDRDENAALNILASGRAGPSGANVAQWGERRLRSPAL